MEKLYQEAYRFEFFQAVRILEQAVRRAESHSSCKQPVGADSRPSEEFVRFRSSNGLGFPVSEIQQITEADAPQKASYGRYLPSEMTINFMGLTGPCSALPFHYTKHLIREKNQSLNDFLDIFNHRSISFFYRAWMKYRLPAAYDHSEDYGHDAISQLFTALVGFGSEGLCGRLAFTERVLQFYAGHFSRVIRPVAVLQNVLSDYFGVRVAVDSFTGRWIDLPRDQQSSLAGGDKPEGQYAELGVSAAIGPRIWDAGGAFRVRVGPVSYHQFVMFMPDSKTKKLTQLFQLTRVFVGPEFTFDVLVILDKDEIPACRIGGDGFYEPRLGWNTWLATGPPEDHPSDAIFSEVNLVL